MASAQEIADLIAAGEAQETYIDGQRETFWAEAPASRPVTPNLIADTKRWATLCGGQTNTEMELMAGHNGSAFSASIVAGTEGSGTIEVVTLPELATHGLDYGGDLVKAAAGPAASAGPWIGSDFRVLLLSVDITRDRAVGPGLLRALGQGRGLFTGWDVGEFQTQIGCFVNVLAHTGEIVLRLGDLLTASPEIGAGDEGQGWRYKHASQLGWGSHFVPAFAGRGSMTVALALLYVGHGDHGGRFIYAQSLGRYSHGADRLGGADY